MLEGNRACHTLHPISKTPSPPIWGGPPCMPTPTQPSAQHLSAASPSQLHAIPNMQNMILSSTSRIPSQAKTTPEPLLGMFSIPLRSFPAPVTCSPPSSQTLCLLLSDHQTSFKKLSMHTRVLAKLVLVNHLLMHTIRSTLHQPQLRSSTSTSTSSNKLSHHASYFSNQGMRLSALSGRTVLVNSMMWMISMLLGTLCLLRQLGMLGQTALDRAEMLEVGLSRSTSLGTCAVGWELSLR